MTAGVITVGRRKYVAGLYWENSPGGSISQVARDAARQSGQQDAFYAVRVRNKSGRVPQFGLAQVTQDMHVGMPVLAACLANQQPGSWAGAFTTREGTVVVVVRDDLIVPDGDLFFADEAEAKERLLQEIGFGGLQRIYAPDAWSVPGADNLPLALLLNDKADVRLQSVELPKKLVIWGGLGVSLLLIVLSAGWYYQEETARQEAERLARIKIMEKAQEEARSFLPGVLQQQAVEYPPPERTWEKLPLPLDIVAACQEGLKKVPAVVVGWSLSSLKCDGSSISVTWQHVSGYAGIPAGASVSESGTSAAMTIQLTAPQARGHEDLLKVADVTKRILGQNWGTTLSRAPEDPLPPSPPGFAGDWSPPPAPWVKRSFTLVAPVLPWSLTGFFSDFPGVVVSSMSFSTSGTRGSWTIEGVIYENRR
ncbi:MAG: type 4b pilus protein PilO2 [Alphaproteobacteria bacterium]|nr:type 4b pilus protein PilO2 [Alphaproteobacteria bacterium]